MTHTMDDLPRAVSVRGRALGAREGEPSRARLWALALLVFVAACAAVVIARNTADEGDRPGFDLVDDVPAFVQQAA